jgi:hypothetical protein
VDFTTQDPVDVFGSAPFLMLEHVAADFFLDLLDGLDVPEHPVLFESLSQLSCICPNRKRKKKKKKKSVEPLACWRGELGVDYALTRHRRCRMETR